MQDNDTLINLLATAHGYLIMQKIEELSSYQVKIAAGTLYGAIENLLKQKLIQSVKNEDNRKPIWIIILGVTRIAVPYLALSVSFISGGQINFNSMFSPKLWYYTPGLWERTGTAFWGGSLFETPLAILRSS